MASSWFLFFSYHNDARSNNHHIKVFPVYVRTQTGEQKYSSIQFVTSTLEGDKWLLHAPAAMLRQISRVPTEKVAE